MKKLLLYKLTFCFIISLQAQNPDTLRLWSEGAPGAKGNAAHDQPALILHHAPEDLATGASVVVCPGGGYGHLAMDHEGTQVATWLNSLGISAYILRYRLGIPEYGDYKHPAMMEDGLRAIRVVRYHAAKWGLDPDKIGILGFSAGGHLASTVGTHFDDGRVDATDPINRQSSRPSFMILCYPVISFTTSYTHRGSRRNLLGDNPTQEDAELLSNELQINTLTPPTFLVHTDADRGVPPENSILFYMGLRRAGVPAEMHIFRQGRHGLGLGVEDLPYKKWPELCESWMRSMDLLN